MSDEPRRGGSLPPSSSDLHPSSPDLPPSSPDLHRQSDAEAPVTGAVPEGESEPDAGTRPESLVGSDPAVPSDESEVIEVRRGMFGVRGTGDTSGYGGLSRTVEFPAASAPPFGGWWDSVYDRIGQLLSGEGDDPLGPPRTGLRRGYSDVITKVVIHRREITFHVAREHLTNLVRHLRDDAQLRFEFCSGVSGVHYPADRGAELHAVYHLQSMTHNRRIRLEVSVADADPHLPSVVPTYPAADWHERETWDMFGVVFDGHPALTRILMPDDWPGHPQRKDYPLGGIAVEYKGASVPPPDQRRSYS